MSTRITLTLPDDIYRRAERLAQLSRREVEQVLADAIAASLPLLRPRPEAPDSVAALSDAQVIALSELQLPPADDRRLSELLDDQQADRLSEADRAELATLFQSYQETLLRKAQGLEEAVRRGLRDPLSE